MEILIGFLALIIALMLIIIVGMLRTMIKAANFVETNKKILLSDIEENIKKINNFSLRIELQSLRDKARVLDEGFKNNLIGVILKQEKIALYKSYFDSLVICSNNIMVDIYPKNDLVHDLRLTIDSVYNCNKALSVEDKKTIQSAILFCNSNQEVASSKEAETLRIFEINLHRIKLQYLGI